jgi:hypothetical protein
MFGILSLAAGLDIVSHSHRRILKFVKRFSFSISFDLIVSKKNLGSFVTRSFSFIDSRPIIRLRGPEGVM